MRDNKHHSIYAILISFSAVSIFSSVSYAIEQQSPRESTMTTEQIFVTEAPTTQIEQDIPETAVATAFTEPPEVTATSYTPAEETPVNGGEYSKERLPENICTNTFFCEDYRLLNVKGTHQYILQQECFTEEETGLRYYLDGEYRYYCVALGTAYGIDIGDAWNVTLENGEEFRVIYADYKHSIEEIDPFDFGDAYDSAGNQLYNYDGKPVINVLEFVIDTDAAPRAMILAGTVSYYERFGGLYGNGGNITEMKYIERMWKP